MKIAQAFRAQKMSPMCFPTYMCEMGRRSAVIGETAISKLHCIITTANLTVMTKLRSILAVTGTSIFRLPSGSVDFLKCRLR